MNRLVTILHIASDLLIGQSYVVIAGLLGLLVYRARSAMPFHSMFLAFGAFIIACGLGHFMHVVLLWRPETAWLYGAVQAATVLVSVATAALLPSYLPKALALVHTAQSAASHQRELAYQASHDSLTGLANRAHFLDALRRALDRYAGWPDPGYAVLFLDLDRFKAINDSHGHPVGDQLLIAVGQRLQAVLRPDDLVARFGGDEFAILLVVGGGHDAVVRLAERIHRQLAVPLQIAGHELFAGATIGIVLGRASYAAPEEVLRDADIALYRAKGLGRGRSVVFDEGMHAQAVASLQLENELRRALERGEFRLHYQPIVDLRRGAVVGVESLVRWQHPERGLVPPGAFIPLAEETGLIAPLGWWVLDEACRQAREWRRRLPLDAPLRVAVNLSARQFAQADLVARVARALAASGLPAHELCLEITESALMEQANCTAVRLAELRALGVRIALDDFGTGYSSLAYLHRFPVDALKIDRSFISGANATEGAIVGAIVQLAHALGLAVVAEGVETAEQLAWLHGLGCDHAQGYHFAPPRPAAEVTALLPLATAA